MVPVFAVVSLGVVVNAGTGALNAAVQTIVVPVTVTAWTGVPLTATFKFAVFGPGAVLEPFRPGAKLTLIVQLAPTARVAGSVPQLLLCGNTSGFGPPKEIPVMVNGAIPPLVIVTGWLALEVRSA